MSGSIVQGVSPSRFMRSPNLAARISALGDVQVEQKFTFGVLISGTLRGQSFHFTGTDDGALGLAVKSFSKPDIEIETEELNQYNKKRLAVKGVKYKPMTLTLYDRADVLENFLASYVGHYIGDFAQPATSWGYDVINAEMIDAGPGFGFGVVPQTPDEQFILNEITIVRGIAAARSEQSSSSPRTVMRLIRPRITDIDFDDMDYQSSDPVLITLTIMYEALLLGGGNDAGEDENFVLKSLDGKPHQLPFEGEVDIRRSKGKSPKDSIFGAKSGFSSFNGDGWRASGQGIGGVLGAFGDFNFGRLAGTLATRAITGGGTRGLGADLAFSATGNPVLATLLNSSSSRTPLADIGSAVLGSTAMAGSPVSAALWGVASSGIGTRGGSRAGFGAVAGNLVSGLLASRTFTGNAANLPVRGGKPTRLSAEDYAVINSRGTGVAQYGFNGPTGFAVPDLGPVTREPLPPATPPDP